MTLLELYYILISDFLSFVFLYKKIFLTIGIFHVFFLNNGSIYFLINVYSESSEIALKYLKNTKANINNILVMVRDFNIRDCSWNPFYLHHFTHSNLLNNITDLMDFCMFKSTNYVSTRYLDNQDDSNSIIDLMFLQPNSSELDNHLIHPDWRLSSDYVPLTVDISIFKEHIPTKKHTIVKNSKEVKNFIIELIETVKSLNTG